MENTNTEAKTFEQRIAQIEMLLDGSALTTEMAKAIALIECARQLNRIANLADACIMKSDHPAYKTVHITTDNG